MPTFPDGEDGEDGEAAGVTAGRPTLQRQSRPSLVFAADVSLGLLGQVDVRQVGDHQVFGTGLTGETAQFSTTHVTVRGEVPALLGGVGRLTEQGARTGGESDQIVGQRGVRGVAEADVRKSQGQGRDGVAGGDGVDAQPGDGEGVTRFHLVDVELGGHRGRHLRDGRDPVDVVEGADVVGDPDRPVQRQRRQDLREGSVVAERGQVRGVVGVPVADDHRVDVRSQATRGEPGQHTRTAVDEHTGVSDIKEIARRRPVGAG